MCIILKINERQRNGDSFPERRCIPRNLSRVRLPPGVGDTIEYAPGGLRRVLKPHRLRSSFDHGHPVLVSKFLFLLNPNRLFYILPHGCCENDLPEATIPTKPIKFIKAPQNCKAWRVGIVNAVQIKDACEVEILFISMQPIGLHGGDEGIAKTARFLEPL